MAYKTRDNIILKINTVENKDIRKKYPNLIRKYN